MSGVSTVYINPWLLAIIIIVVVVAVVFVVIWSVRAHKRKVAAGKEDLIGRTAVVITSLNPKGIVFVEDERWEATIENGTAEPDEEVIITGVNGLKLTVTRK